MFPGLKAIPAFQGGGSAGSGGAISMSFVASSDSTASTIMIPASAIAGDFAILFDCAGNTDGSSISTVVPTGWTQLANSTVSASRTIRQIVSYRKLTAGQPGTSISPMYVSGDSARIMLVFRPSTSIVTITPSTWNDQATTGNPTLQTVTALGQTAPLIVFAAGGSTGPVPAFSTETPALTNITRASPGTHTGLRVGYIIYNSSPANQSIDTGDDGENVLQSGFVRFA